MIEFTNADLAQAYKEVATATTDLATTALSFQRQKAAITRKAAAISEYDGSVVAYYAQHGKFDGLRLPGFRQPVGRVDLS